MKLPTSLFAVAALLASCVSSIPLDQPVSVPGLSVRTTSKTDYDISGPIKNMFDNNHASLQGVCQTNGGWEVAVQVLLETELRKSFKFSRKTHASLREKAVYTDSSMAADFVLPETKDKNGMIIELKCENANSNAGAKMQSKVQGDIDKIKKLKDEYKGYKFVVVAMAYSTKAEDALTTGLQLQVIPGAVLEIEESVYDGSSRASSETQSDSGKDGSDTEMKDGSDTEMKDVSDTRSDSGKSDKSQGTKSDSGKSDKSQDSQGTSSSTKSLKVKAYQKEIDAQAPDTNKKAPTKTSDRLKAQKAQNA